MVQLHPATPKSERGWQIAKYTEEEIIAAVNTSLNMNTVIKKLKMNWPSVYRIKNIMYKYNLKFLKH